jgi:hypothetical protein
MGRVFIEELNTVGVRSQYLLRNGDHSNGAVVTHGSGRVESGINPIGEGGRTDLGRRVVRGAERKNAGATGSQIET